MHLSSNPKVWKGILVIFAIMSAFFLLCFYFKMIFVTFVIGFVMIFLTDRLMKAQRTRAEKSKMDSKQIKWYLLFQLLFWSVIVTFIMYNSTSNLSNAVSDIIDDERTVYDIYKEQYSKFLPEFVNDKVLNENNIEIIEIEFLKVLSEFFSSLGFIIFNGVLIIPLLFYLYFKKRHLIISKLASSFPKKYHDVVGNTFLEIGRELRDFFGVKVVESIIIGLICCLGFYFAGLEGWFLLGFLAGFLNIIPYLGPILGAVPPLLVSLYDSPIVTGIVLVTILIAQLIDNFYLIPFMISDKVEMNSLLSVILILVGAQVFGVMGMVFAIPIYLIYEIILVESYKALVKIFDS